MDRLEIAKAIIRKYIKYGDCGIFDCRNWAGDPMVTIYEDEKIQIDICFQWAYFEVFGLLEEDFDRLEEYYNEIK